MSQSAEAKLQELRGKTNRQLVSLIVNKLDRGIAYVRVAAGDSSDWASSDHFLGDAEAAWNDATAWMAMLNNAAEIDQRRLEYKAAQLRSAIERARGSQLRVHAAC